MMNTKGVCVAVIFLCAVLPVFGGFLMPSEINDEVTYITDAYTDITDGLENAVEDFPTYNSTYINNQYIYRSAVVGVDYVLDGSTTTTTTSFPYLFDAEDRTYTQSGSNADISVDLNNTTSSTPWAGTQLAIFSPQYIGGSGASKILDSTGTEYEIVLWWTETKLAYGYNYGSEMVQIDPHITITTRYHDPNLTYYVSYWQQGLSQGMTGDKLYFDPSLGFKTTGGQWTNANENTIVSMVVDTTSVGYTADGVHLYISVDDGIVYASTESAADRTHPLGSSTVYDKLNIIWDTLQDRIEVYGLNGMDRYNLWPANYAKNSLVFEDVGFTGDISLITMGYSATPYRYYVPYSMTAGGTELKVIKNNILSMASYFPNEGMWGMQLRSVIVYGDSLHFDIETTGGNTGLNFHVEDGYFKNIPIRVDTEHGVVLESVDIPVANVQFKVVPMGEGVGVYINDYLLAGEALGNGSVIEDVKITFEGAWSVPVQISKIATKPIHTYEWGGGFNINGQTYCTFGLITAILCAIFGALMLRDGQGNAIAVVILAGICGAVYLAVMTTF